ncbi:MAG: hypothetical protein WC701_06125 [Kiritimatiellales bacterium]|jgi:hypothetical protein
MKKPVNILLLLAVAVFSLRCTGDLMRKNDQAAILAGAYDMAHGRMQNPSAYYQFDKTYVLYGVCASVLKIFSGGNSPVAVANVSLALIFWSALTVFVVYFRKVLSPLALLCFLTAPAVLLNTLYVNSSVLSSAFLLLSAVFLLQSGQRGGWLSALFFALAVGSRADVILLLPLLLWLITPFSMLEKFPKGFSRHWKISAAGLVALGTGLILCSGGATADPIFNLKMVAGYAVFGFGAAGLLFTLYAVCLTMLAAKGRGAFEKLYGLAGLAAFLLPVLFFIPQLHAPRYFWRGCEAVLLLAASGRLPVWNSRTVKTLTGFAALFPLILCVKLSALDQLRITVSHPALFPSGDGFYPMGGYLPFMIRLRHAGEHPVDHNQLIWNAVQQADFRIDDRKSISVLRTPMFGYFMLAASLRGGYAEELSYVDLSNRCFYADSRSLMRADPKTPIRFSDEVLSLPAHFISSVFNGVGILEFGTGDDRWGRQTRLLNRLFAGSEYRIVLLRDPAEFPDRTMVAFSSQPFENARQDDQTGLYYSEESGSCLAPGVCCAVSVLPSWMSFQAFKGSGQ